MKFCKYKTYENTVQGIINSHNYVLFSEIENFHGKEFAQQWLVFVEQNGLKPTKFDLEEGYYYSDYQFYARRTEQWLHPVS